MCRKGHKPQVCGGRNYHSVNKLVITTQSKNLSAPFLPLPVTTLLVSLKVTSIQILPPEINFTKLMSTFI